MTEPTEFTPDYLLIGHIAHDVTPQGPQLGGTVSYAAHTAAAFGLKVAILTSTRPQELLLADLPHGASVHSVPSEHTTIFENIYTDSGRTQYIHHRAQTLTPDMLPPAWRSAKLVHLAPIANEIDLAFAAFFADRPICVTPQGWMRHREPDGLVTTMPWDAAEYVLPYSTVAVLSEEDIRHDPSLEYTFANMAPLLILTRAERGGTVYYQGEARQFAAHRVTQVEPTGAGDIFATVFHILYSGTGVYQCTGSIDNAVKMAAMLASKSVQRVRLASAPTPDEITEALAACADN
ncbi:MAG: hypothetical protein JW966_02855 [Anaerolineae bacterium]|nr:hypothetical protein [Anaerolineae bacterium]